MAYRRAHNIASRLRHRDKTIDGPFTVRVVLPKLQIEYYLKNNKPSYDGTQFTTLRSARRAARKFIVASRSRGLIYVDIQDANDHERSIPV